MPKKLNILNAVIIGTGLIGNKRADAILELPQYKLVSAFDVNPESLDKFCQKYNCHKSNLNQIIHNDTIDLVILAINHQEAARLAPKILRYKNLLMEKPIGRNIKETKRIINIATKYKHNLFGGFNYHFYPHITKAKQMIQHNIVGDILSSTFIIGHGAQPSYEKTWKMDKKLCGGGVIIDPGVHMIDLMTFLIGISKKYTVIKNSLGWNTSVEDEAAIVFQYPNNSFSIHHYSLNLSKNTLFIEIVGSKGTLRLNGRGGNYGDMTLNFTPKWHWIDNKPIIDHNYGKVDNSFFEELQHIYKILNQSKIPDYTIYLNNMKIISNIYRKK